MISAGEFRNGMTFEMDGQVLQIVEFQHVKPGKGAAFVRTKIKNVITGSVTERTFNPTDKFPPAYVDRRDMQYLYNDGDLYYFMDMAVSYTHLFLQLNRNAAGQSYHSASISRRYGAISGAVANAVATPSSSAVASLDKSVAASS